jgi:hypothetical protein
MEAAILTILLPLALPPLLTQLVSLKASQNCRAPIPEKLEATERRRSNYLPGCSRLEPRAGGSGSRHLEPPLSPPFLSRSPPPPEMAEPRPGSHTPRPQHWLASGAGGKEPQMPRLSQLRRQSDHNCGSRHLETVLLPHPALSTTTDRRTPTFLSNKGVSEAGGTGSNSQLLLEAPTRMAREVLHLSLESASAIQAVAAALGAAILRLASLPPPTPPILFFLDSSSTANQTQGSVQSSLPSLRLLPTGAARKSRS